MPVRPHVDVSGMVDSSVPIMSGMPLTVPTTEIVPMIAPATASPVPVIVSGSRDVRSSRIPKKVANAPIVAGFPAAPPGVRSRSSRSRRADGVDRRARGCARL